jgi:hypothetical protein
MTSETKIRRPRLSEGNEMRRIPTLARSVTVTIDGVAYHGSYFVQRSMIYVRSPLGAKATQVGGSPPEVIAKLLLLELVQAPDGRPSKYFDLPSRRAKTWAGRTHDRRTGRQEGLPVPNKTD